MLVVIKVNNSFDTIQIFSCKIFSDSWFFNRINTIIFLLVMCVCFHSIWYKSVESSFRVSIHNIVEEKKLENTNKRSNVENYIVHMGQRSPNPSLLSTTCHKYGCMMLTIRFYSCRLVGPPSAVICMMVANFH